MVHSNWLCIKKKKRLSTHFITHKTNTTENKKNANCTVGNKVDKYKGLKVCQAKILVVLEVICTTKI